MSSKYTKELLEIAVAKSESTAGVLRTLGIKLSGSSQCYIGKLIKHYQIDTSHFKNPKSFLCGGGNNKLKWQDILICRKSGGREHAFRLRRALIESGREYKCEGKSCLVKNDWLGQEIKLQVNHKNGDWLNNSPDNLEFLCPNCHSQTLNWSGSKGKTTITSRKTTWIPRSQKKKQKIKPKIGNVCAKCTNPLKHKEASYCNKCWKIVSRTVERPPYEQLLKEIQESNFCAVGRKYGVSDTAVRKWIKYYEKIG